MAIKRPTSGLTPQDLEAGQFLIEGGQQGAVTNIPGVASAPRPVGVSTAPRPTTFDSFAPVARPSEASSRLLRRMTAEQKGGGSVSDRARKVQAFELAETAPERKLLAEQEKQKRFEQQKALKEAPALVAAQGRLAEANIQAAVDREKISSEAKTASEELAVKERIAEADRAVDQQLAENEVLLNTRDNETKVQIANMQDRTRRLQASIDASGTVTPQQEFAMERLKSNTARLVGIEKDMAIELENDPNPETNKALRILGDFRTAIVSANNDLQDNLETQGVEETVDAGVEAGAEAGAQAGAEAVSDINDDGIVDANEERFNRLDAQLQRKKELVDNGVLTPAQLILIEDEHKQLKASILGR